jgi:uncharacterized membrane-anchored protein YhcB (DUF1043 family)
MQTSILANPAVLTVIFGAIGAAITWLWRQVSKAQARHRECEIELATMKERLASHDKEMAAVQATCATLTELLRKEVNIG